jgi:MYXO-CTERM domain-containing protein
LGICASLTGQAAAQDDHGGFFPPITRHYGFLPRLSVLTKTGGIAGMHERYHVRGTYDFTRTMSPLAVFPPVFIGDFENVRAVGFQPLDPDDKVDVDLAFNLTGLEGHTPLGGPPNVFHFRGTTADDSHVRLWAAQIGPWMLLRGETRAPEGSADFFEYQIKAVARTRPLADFNDDGVVDRHDLTAWIANHDRIGGDLLEWQRQLGEEPPLVELDAAVDAAIAAAAINASSSVPEPGAMALAAMGLVLLARRRR